MDFNWSEMMVVAVVALVVIGPKELPGAFRELGRFTAKIRAMGREFSRAMEQAAKESGVQDVANDLKKVTSPKAMGLDAVKSAADRFEKWDPLKNAPKPVVPAAAAAAVAPVVAEAAVAGTAAAKGPETAALAEKVAARKAVASEAAARLRSVAAGAAELEAGLEPGLAAPEAAAKKPARARKKADKPAGDAA